MHARIARGWRDRVVVHRWCRRPERRERKEKKRRKEKGAGVMRKSN